MFNGNKFLLVEFFVFINVCEQQSGEKFVFNCIFYNVKVFCNILRDIVIYCMCVVNMGGLGNNWFRYKFQKRLDYFYMMYYGNIKV